MWYLYTIMDPPIDPSLLAKYKRTGGFPRKEREARAAIERAAIRAAHPLPPEHPHISISEREAYDYKYRCPDCRSTNFVTCKCSLSDHRCLGCDAIWHVCRGEPRMIKFSRDAAAKPPAGQHLICHGCMNRR
jgi:hypothetical protein